jgi:hypothetical protein
MLFRAPARASMSLPPVAEATRAATFVMAAVALGLAVAYAALPAYRDWLAAGNGLTDATTAVLLLLTLGAGWWALRRTPDAPRWCRLLLLAAALGFLDEVHYGSGLLGFDLLRLGGVTLDGLSSLLAAAHRIAEDPLGLSPLDLAAAAAVVAALAAFILARHHRAARVADWLRDRPPAVHLLGAATLVTVAAILDVFDSSGVVGFAEEWLEFVAAAVLFRGVLLIPRRRPEATGWRQRLRPWLDRDNLPRAGRGAPPPGAQWPAPRRLTPP